MVAMAIGYLWLPCQPGIIMLPMATKYFHNGHNNQVSLWLLWEPPMDLSYGWLSSCGGITFYMLCYVI